MQHRQPRTLVATGSGVARRMLTEPARERPAELPSVVLTPYIAGSLGGELARMANSGLDEVDRHSPGPSLTNPITREDLARSA